MKVGIVGSRTRTTDEDFEKVYMEFMDIAIKHNETLDRDYQYGDTHIVSGGQKLGADSWAERIARENGQPITIYNADWKVFYRAAGPIRNEFIARDSEKLIACLGDDSKGTKDTIEKFKRYHPDGELIIV